MLMLLLVISSCLCLSTFMLLTNLNYWLSLMIILIYISGIMVLFMFIVSLAPNEKTPLKSSNFTVFLVLGSLVMMTFSKTSLNSENLKINSLFKYSITPMMLMTLILLLMAYLPPKMVKAFYKGMKTSK